MNHIDAEPNLNTSVNVIFRPKPVVVLLSLAFGTALYSSETQAAENLAGSYTQQVSVVAKGSDAPAPNTTAYSISKVNGGNGQDASVQVVADTTINTLFRATDSGLVVNSSGGNGSHHEGNGVRNGELRGGKGGNGGAIQLQLSNGALLIQTRGQGLSLDSHGGNAGNNSNKEHPATAGVGGAVAVQAQGQEVQIATTGVGKHAIGVNSSGGNGARGLFDNGNAFWTTMSPSTDGANAGEVVVNLNGHTELNTSADGSNALNLQSRAGNGGEVGNGVNVGYGGKGGKGGNGGQQTVLIGSNKAATSLIKTSGNEATAIVMQSVGGNGGSVNSGSSISNTKEPGNAGHGGNLALNLEHTQILTSGDNSSAVLMQSVGGYGGSPVTGSKTPGNGGAAGRITVSVSESSAISTSGQQSDGVHLESLGGSGSRGPNGFFMAGKGGKGGAGQDITVNNQGSITTKGKQSSAIYALSAGGAAGDGGSSTGVIVSLGGRGGESGNGGKVSITNTGRLNTSGDESHVILAQSIGGSHGRLNTNNNYELGSGGQLDGNDSNAASVEINNTGLVSAQGNAVGIMAQSIGGGGGNGGGAFGFVSLGGGAGSSGNAGQVKVDNSGTIVTSGQVASSALVLQSIGGGGGYGGKASGAASGIPMVTIGGKGGNGGNANEITLNQSGTIATSGYSSPSIIAQSIGGGGGMGGASFAVGAYQPLALSIGGSGGKGGSGGQINVTLDAQSSVLTTGDASAAVLLQSIGGGGGNGGDAYSVQGASLAPVTIGGQAGVGGKGGAVNISNQGTVLTKGDDSFGIVAQSIGGGGGQGGFSSNMAVTGFPVSTDGQSLSLQTAIGGKGGNGNVGGEVTFNNTGDLLTQGQSSVAVLLQSIGGGGGNGGSTSTKMLAIPRGKNIEMHIAVGGDGGSGNKGGNVVLNNQGSIRTFGQLATAVMIQSIGGGGGNGGAGSANSYRYDGATSGDKVNREVFKLAATVGGKGGKGSDGGAVTLNNAATGQIETAGDMAAAVVAQSIGGGGGNGGLSHSDAVAVDRAVELKIGGNGGDGGVGGTVTVNNAGSINTSGVGSVGVLTQSIGGGGGRGGVAGGAGSESEDAIKKMNKDLVDLTEKVKKKTNEGKSEVQKIIDGLVDKEEESTEKKDEKKDDSKSKDTKFVTNVNIGGSGGNGGNGGQIVMVNTGRIATMGNLSAGILAQSIGGGGGDGADTQVINSAAKSKHYDLVVGASGGKGNKGGNVSLNNSGYISVAGIGADAITLQSIGGGGGRAGSSSAQGNTAEEQYSLVLGGNGGSGGDAGNVALTNQKTGSIEVAAGGGHALLVQSIGGGGGEANLTNNKASAKEEDKEKNLVDGDSNQGKKSIKLALGGRGGAGGHGGAITINNAGNIDSAADVSTAILAQSIGGGGGVGGAAQTENNTKAEVNLSVAIGGSGGKGSNGGKVSLNNTGSIQTTQKQTTAIVLQSIGGGGGYAGLAQTDGNVKAKTLQLSLGGNGGEGGKGGVVELTNNGNIFAGGSAILAQSIGGGGGYAAGADSVINAAKEDDDKEKSNKSDQKEADKSPIQTRSISLIMGGTGGNGGDAGQVSVTNTGRIEASADLMAAIVAQSISGGGGSGGAAINDNQAEVDSSWNLALGGNAGNGKTGGVVTVNNQGNIITTGLHSGAIIAQSIGGGGGTGGLVNQDVLSAKQKAWSLSVGAQNGSSGHGGKVSVINSGNLAVKSGIAILGQSIGGGGGLASLAQTGLTAEEMAAKVEVTEGKIEVSLGARKGKEGKGGEVNLSATGNINTEDSQSLGVLGQSIGGGGGHLYVQQAQNFTSDANAYHVGSQNGKGSAGKVYFTHSNNGIAYITTAGAGSVGVLLQSLGGGGGSLLVKQTDARNQLGSVIVGGVGTESGHGTEVTLGSTANSHITTTGNNAVGVLAQSIGGGGGYVDFLSGQTQTLAGIKAKVQLGGNQVVGNGGQVDAHMSGSIVTQGKNSHGLLVQSIGGGGGYVVTDAAANQVSTHLGGINGSRGNAGQVKIDNQGDIITSGDGSYGILAQSIGGGGGIAADTSVLVLQKVTKNIATTNGLNVQTEGNGGNVQINHVGSIVVKGQNAHAIVAQSIANGGGIAQQGVGNVLGSKKKSQAGNIDINIGNNSKVAALGKNGIGIFAQLAASDSVNGNNMGHIKINLQNTDLQAEDTGIDMLGGNASNAVNLKASHIQAGQFGIVQEGVVKKQQVNIAQSSSVLGGNTAIKLAAVDEAQVSVDSSLVKGGKIGLSLSAKKAAVTLKNANVSAADTAIELNAQDEHKLQLTQSYMTDSATAIKLMGSGKVNIEIQGGQVGKMGRVLLQQSNSDKAMSISNNQGWLAGNIAATGKVSVTNKDANSTIEMGNNWNLNGGKLENKGQLYIAGKGSIGTTYLNGELQQNGSGKLFLDADFANNRHDQLVLTNTNVGADLHETKIIIDAISYKPGASATIISTSGNKQVRFNKSDKNKDKSYKFQIIAGENDLFKYDFKREYTQNLIVTPKANFTNSTWYKQGLNQDQRNVANYLQNDWNRDEQVALKKEAAASTLLRSVALQTASDSNGATNADELGDLYGQMDNLTSATEYSRLLSNLASDVQSSPAAMMPMHNRQFINKMFTCQAMDGSNVMSEDACVWMDSRYNRTRFNSTFEDFGYKLKSSSVQFGGEYEFKPQWWLGGSLGYEDIVANSQEVAVETDGSSVSGGIFLKHIQEPWQWAAAYSFNRGAYETNRWVQLPVTTVLAKSEWNSWLHALSFRGAYTHSWEHGYLRPSVDAILMYQKNPAYKEYGAGSYNLEVGKESRLTLMLSPQVELAQSFRNGVYTWMPYASVGMNWMSDDNWHTQMRIQGAHSDDWIHVNTDMPQVTADAKLGLDVMRRNGLGVKLEYSGQWGQRYQSHTGRIRLAYQF